MPTPVEIASCINALKTAFPNYQPDIPATADLWKTVFSDMEGETLKAAVLVCLTQNRAFAPSAGEIRAAAMDLHAKASGIPSALEAYAEAADKPKSGPRIGDFQLLENGTWGYPCGPVEWSHPLVQAVARNMGWPDTFPTDMPAADRSQFVKAYDSELVRYMADAGRLPAVQKYIEEKAETMRGNAPALMGSVLKRLEKS